MGFHKDLCWPAIHPKWKHLLTLTCCPTVRAPWTHSARHFPGTKPRALWGSGRWRSPLLSTSVPSFAEMTVTVVPRRQGRKVSGPGNGKGFRRLAVVFVVVIQWPWSMSQHRECAAGPGSSLRAWYPELDSQLHELLNSLQGVPLMLTVCSRMPFRF